MTDNQLNEVVRLPLSMLAHGRSGDKGDSVNIGLIAHETDWLPVLESVITPEWLANLFGEEVKGDIEVYSVPGVGAVNCVLNGALQGGGTVSLRKDAQGKLFGQVILQAEVDLPIQQAIRLGLIQP